MESASDDVNRYYLAMQNAVEPRELILSSKGLGCVNWDCGGADFEFVVGDRRACRVHSVLAEYLSPKVARLRRCDISFDVYTFKDSEMFDIFESFVSSLLSGEVIRVEKSNFAALLRLSQELENGELFSSLLEMIKTESLSLQETIVLLRAGTALGAAFSDRFENLRDIIASHFYEIKKEILDNLDIETTQLILSSPSLQIEDEDSLYDFICYRSQTDLRFKSLFEFIYFDYLSVDRIEDFVSFVSENFRDKISSGIWGQVCRRLILEAKPREKNHHDLNGADKEEVAEEPTEGVIARLTRECGGNVHDKGIVNVTASSVTGFYQPKNAVDLETDRFYQSRNKKDSWICYDFKYRRVIPTSYSVRTYGSGPGHRHLKSWVIEVSDYGSSWKEIDRRDDNYDLNDAYASAHFKISNVPSEGVRFFRLKQTGENHFGDYEVVISSLEIFGSLIEK